MKNRKYFLQVQTYMSVSKLGRAVAGDVFKLYNHAVVTEGSEVERMVDTIKCIIDEQMSRNPRCKPMRLILPSGCLKTPHGISLRPQLQTNDNYAFCIIAYEIEHEYIEQKGGLA